MRLCVEDLHMKTQQTIYKTVKRMWFKVVFLSFASLALHSNVIDNLQKLQIHLILHVLLQNKVRNKVTIVNGMLLIKLFFPCLLFYNIMVTQWSPCMFNLFDPYTQVLHILYYVLT